MVVLTTTPAVFLAAPWGLLDVLHRPCVVRRAGFRRGVGAATCRKFGRHRDSVLTDFAGINGGFDHRSNILAPHRHAARTLAWLWCLPDVRARRRCAGDALLPGKEGYYVRRRAQGGDRGVELLVQTYGKTYGSLPIKNKSEHRFQSNHFQT